MNNLSFNTKAHSIKKNIGEIMPTVGKKKFAYSKAGMKKAKMAAKKKGIKVKYKKR